MRIGVTVATTCVALLPVFAAAQQNTPPPQPATPPRADTTLPPPIRITLDDAIRLALQYDHALQAARTTILQNQAQEITANLRPNPVISWDSQFFPLFIPKNLAPVISIPRRNSILESAICSSAAKSASIACKPRAIKRSKRVTR